MVWGQIYRLSERKARYSQIDFHPHFRYFGTLKKISLHFILDYVQMAQHPSALKRARASKRREARNTALKTRMKTAVKRVRTAPDKEKALVELKKTTKLLDQMAAKGIIHKNKAANNKSALTKLVRKMT